MFVYLLLVIAAMLEKVGQTTSDTKTALIETPHEFLASTFNMWNPLVSLGELQNQAYGYLFPMGPFFLLGDIAQVPPWVTERFWSVVVLIVGIEGGRRLCLAMGLSAWPAWVAGMAYGLNPRVLSEVAVRSAEILPGAVLPWMVLPIVHALTGRRDPRAAAVLSVAAFVFFGAVNGTATIAPLPLVVVFLIWGIRQGRAKWSLFGWWSALIVLVSIWWATSLLKLNAFSPPFFDYVEDAPATTRTTGFLTSLRGAENWVSFLQVGDHPGWPAGYDVSYSPWLVLFTGLLAALGVMGLVTFRSPWRRPLIISAGIGLVCLTVAHMGLGASPLAGFVQSLLDGPFALLRNVAKIDPVLRLPLAVGVGAAVARLLQVQLASPRRWLSSAWVKRTGLAVVAVLLIGSVQPLWTMDLRTPGWSEIPKHWHQTAAFLERQSGNQRAWIIPGSGFGVQDWGWTQDEPMSAVATTPWVTRSQVPLVPPETLRMLTRMEDYLESGSGSPYLGAMLARSGLGYVVVRHDLDETLADATSSGLVSISLARSRGVERVAEFGRMGLGPAIEIYQVVGDEPAPDISLKPAADAVTVAGGTADVLDAVGQNLIGPAQAALVQGEPGWDRPADVVGDNFRARERDFGRVHYAEGPMLSRDEPRTAGRLVPNYPGSPGTKPAYVKYSGVRDVIASSSQGQPGQLGAVTPANAPFAAVDGDLGAGWRSAFYRDPQGQWLEVRFPKKRTFGTIKILSSTGDGPVLPVREWRVTAGKVSRTAKVDPFTGKATVDLRGAGSDRIRFTATKVRSKEKVGSVSILELTMAGLPAQRTLVLPEHRLAAQPDYLFTAMPETRTCIPTLIAPECDRSRRRLSDEATGIDRTIEVPEDGQWFLHGTAIARARLGTANLLDPFIAPVKMSGSSILEDDPTVSARMAYDGNPATSWIASPQDGEPTLRVQFAKPRRIDRIFLAGPARPGVIPTQARIVAGDQVREVDLGEFGTFAPLTAKRLRITFSNPTANLAPLGMSEIRLLPGKVELPLVGDTPTGNVCGFGPRVEVDGRTFDTRVRGLMGDVQSSGPLAIEPCEGPMTMTRGTHRVKIVSTEQFQPTSVVLAARKPPTTTPETRALDVRSSTNTRQVVRVGAGEESILTTTRNFNAGWRATLHGDVLDPVRSDGWAQGWVVPAGSGGTVEIEYTPGPSYFVTLIGGLVLAGLTLLVALLILLRTRVRPLVVADAAPTEPPLRQPSRRRRWLGRVGAVAAVPLAWLLVGVPGAVAVVVAALLRRRRRLTLVLAAVLLTSAAVVAAVAQIDAPSLPSKTGDVLAGLGVCLALIRGLMDSRQDAPL